MHDLIGVLLESLGTALTAQAESDQGWLYILGYFVLIAVAAALTILFFVYR